MGLLDRRESSRKAIISHSSPIHLPADNGSVYRYRLIPVHHIDVVDGNLRAGFGNPSTSTTVVVPNQSQPGPKGDTGATGAAGSAGAAGAAGASGATGAAGAPAAPESSDQSGQ